MILDKFEFRKLDKREFFEASNLVWDVFSEFEAPEYSDEGIKNFKDFIKPDQLYENSKNGFMSFWGCFDNQKLVGIIASRESCHISLLFVKKEYHHKGIARMLFNKLKTEIVSGNLNIEFITVNSSPFAVKIYERFGFTAADKELLQDGLRFTPMKYKLPSIDSEKN